MDLEAKNGSHCGEVLFWTLYWQVPRLLRITSMEFELDFHNSRFAECITASLRLDERLDVEMGEAKE